MQYLVNALLLLGSFVLMEGVAWAAHKYIMHGWGWGWHRSHHEPRRGALEKNDLYAVVGAATVVPAANGGRPVSSSYSTAPSP